MLRQDQNVNYRIERSTSTDTNNVQSPLDDSQCHSINTIQSIPRDYIISEDLLAGQRLNGRMSNVRRFFCLFVTFDFLFSGLMWTICVMLKGEYLVKALSEQIVHYDIHTSLFDVVFVSFFRFTVLLLFYAIIYINHWIIIAFSTALTSIFLASKVVLYDWPHSKEPVYEVLFVLTSFVLSWGEAWFFDYRVIPQETYASRFLINNVEPERAPLINRYIQGLPSLYTESVGNFYSPLNTPNGSLYEAGVEHDAGPSITREQEEEYKKQAAKALEDAYALFQHADWKLMKEKDGDKVYTREESSMGKLYKLSAQLNVSPRFMLDEIFFRVNDFSKWSPLVKESYKIQTIDENTDICYQMSTPAAGGLVSSRDFVNIRKWCKIDDKYVIAFAKTEHPSAPKMAKCIRGENGIGCWVLEPIENNSNKCNFHWMLHSNLNIRMPTFLLGKEFVEMMFNYLNDVRNLIKSKTEQNIS